jgi:hypothetical protein
MLSSGDPNRSSFRPRLSPRSPARLLAVALSVALLVPAAGAMAAPAQWLGINDLSSVSGAVPFAQSASLAAAAGANSTRLIVDWSWIEPQNGVYHWGVVDGVYWADMARGIRPLIGVTGAPRWAWDASARCPAQTTCAFPPGTAHGADFQDLLRRLTRRYPLAVGVEIGNEPNLSWAWAGGLDPARYTQLVKLGYTAVKSVNPAMPVIAGGLAPVLTDATTKDSIGLRPFLQAMYDNGVRGHMDGISIHPYSDGVDFSKSFKAISLAKETSTANGDAVPLWVTEFGLTTTGPDAFSEYQQGITLPALDTALRADPDIRAVYVHTLRDNPANAIPAERGYGLLHADLTPKPAYCGLAAANGSPWSCPPGAPAASPTATQSARWAAQVLLQDAADAARRVHVARGSYGALTAADLHAADPRISTTAADPRLMPGGSASPDRIGVYPGQNGQDWLVLCNTSQADRSYCISTVWRGAWAYGSATGNINQAAAATIKGASASW